MSLSRTLGLALVGYDHNGNLVVDRDSLQPASSPRGFGYGADDDFGADDFGADDDFVSGLSSSEASYYGALSKAERREYRKRKRGMRRGNRNERENLRDWRREQRQDDDGGAGSPAVNNAPAMRPGMNPYVFSDSFTIAAAGPWSIRILPLTEAVLNDFWCTGPAGTALTQLSVGVLPVVPSGYVDLTVFGSTSFIRDLIRGRKVTPSLPITISGTTTASTGVIGAGVSGVGP